MKIKDQVKFIELPILDDLLTGYHINHGSIDDYKCPGMNINMQHVISSLRSNYHVIIDFSRKDDGYWYISAKNAAQFRQNPWAQRVRKENMDTERKNQRLTNAIINICENHPKKVVACLDSKINKTNKKYTH
ncbi:TPA: hypothetical protein ACN35N_003571 [Vibrio parahaemolyticus]